MHRYIPVLLLVWLVGCASPAERQAYWDSQRAVLKVEEERLRVIYGAAFERGFLDAWAGRYGVGCRFDESTDPEGDTASDSGYRDGQMAGRKARSAPVAEQAEFK
jgi:hypothetical protein